MDNFYSQVRPAIAPNLPPVIELFAGGGGWAAGFEIAGFKSNFAVEFDPTNPKLSGKLADCHEINFPNCKVIRQTVQDCDRVNWPDFPKESILVVSPVCANFSDAKHGAVEEQSDIDCAIAVANAITKLSPKVFVLEQVAKYEQSRSWRLIKEQLEIEGYKISIEIVNMRDWGVPQLARKRIIVVASKDFKFQFPNPQGGDVCWWNAIADLDLESSELLQKQKDAIAKYNGDRNKPLLIQRTANRGDCKIFPAGQPAPTLTKSIFCDGKGDSRSRFFDIVFPDGQVKALSLRAAARIQGFPDWWLPTCGAAIGYAVPPMFSFQLFTSIKNAIATNNLSNSIDNNGFDESVVPTGREEITVGFPVKETVTRSQRHDLDRYDSPHWFITAIAPYIDLRGTVIEPCYGSGILADCLQELGVSVWGNDINPDVVCDRHLDATIADNWKQFPRCDWVITNCPYGEAVAPILKNSWEHCDRGVVLLVRTTWDEPCDDRAQWLYDHPYTRKIILPRFKFRKGKDGSWQTDSATISAFIWDKKIECQPSITIPVDRIELFHNRPDNAPAWDDVVRLCGRLRSRLWSVCDYKK